MGKFEDLTGQRFGYLTIIKKAGKNKSDKILWLCKCDCGKLKIIQGASLKSGRTKSCGCLRKKGARRTHGFKHTRLYCIWQGIKKRCLNKNTPNYHIYGGRGITICQDWLNSFVSFYKWAMGNGYADNLTIDRIDLDGDYSPSNCRWITQAEQNRNTSRIRWIEKNDGTKITSAEAARIAGLSRATVARWCRVDGIRTLQGILQRADEVHSRHSKGVKNSGEKILLAETDG